jgi:glycosyltransferase involved in cell wall biosynthesis
MPVYNAGWHLRDAVHSIISQSYKNWELIIIDDGSSDGAVDMLPDNGDERIRIFKNPINIGIAASLNLGIDLARGDYFARMDADDISYPDRLERQINILESNLAIDLVGVRCLAINEYDKPIGALPFALTHQSLCSAPWRGFYLPHPTWVGRIEWFRKHRYSYPAPYRCEDQELLLRTYSISNFATLSEILFAYRIRTTSISLKILKTRKSVLLMQIKHLSRSDNRHFIILSFLFFLMRVINDLGKIFYILVGWSASLHSFNTVDEFELNRFKKILFNLKG